MRNQKLARNIALLSCLFSTAINLNTAHAESFPQRIRTLTSNRAEGSWSRADRTKNFYFKFRPGSQPLTISLKAKTDNPYQQIVSLKLLDEQSKRPIPGGSFFISARQNYTQQSRTINISNNPSVIIKVSAENNSCTSRILPGGVCPTEANYHSGDFVVMLSSINRGNAVQIKPGTRMPEIQRVYERKILKQNNKKWIFSK